MYEKDYYEGNTVYEKVTDVALYEGLEGINESLSGIYEVLLQLLKVVEAEKKPKPAGFKVGAEIASPVARNDEVIAKIFGN
ncbi:MAG: hypothetical protein FWD97_02810 [Defluviitaleaceae bacterium]|nr:hypothetical protein [Defluviitaleaceae bacterium]